ncbi:hypothetical protein CFP65_2277 [Kitasatospora sp. MMS16-BH015]|uniref:hypothetical protein n=1 Tax=Kitasatospora sp. MMS16-BH015 TaxID=2018025 RepID=UPI000CA0AB26|nr:hypothetical protein [Kitasatospora sp. MMS16-BH015]AUG77117.1 hypothetical protein CFP65_2277 [Kitasatospora sp. MMS16-BH015]
MRFDRSLLAAAAATAVLALASPAAHAEAQPVRTVADGQPGWQDSQSGKEEPKKLEKSEGRGEGKAEEVAEEAPWHKDKKPHGGVHTGGGGLAVSTSGLATGGALLAGGLAVGAYSLRRRGNSTP